MSMGLTFLNGFGSSPGPMTLASSMFSDSEPNFSFASFTSQVIDSPPNVFTLPPGISPSCFLDSPSLSTSVKVYYSSYIFPFFIFLSYIAVMFKVSIFVMVVIELLFFGDDRIQQGTP